MSRLQVKLFAAFLCVILTSVGISVIYVKQGAEQEIVVYEERTERLYMLRMEHWLLGYYAHGGGWDDISIYIEEMEVLSGQRVILTDPEGLVMADSQGELHEQYFEPEDWPSRPLMQHRGEGMLGILYISPEPTIETELTRELAASINYSLYIGSLISMGIALLLTVILSRAIASPVKELAESALRVGKGDFSYQVRVADKGEFGELAQAFNRMSRDLARSSLLRRHLAADIAHELRTPLTNIRGYIEAMKDNLVDTQSGIDLVEEESAQLSRLVDDLQELGLAEAGVLKLNFQEVQAVPEIRKAVNHYKSQAMRKGVSLETDLNKQDITIRVDVGRMNQMLKNLISNALTHTVEGESITVRAERIDNSLMISVADTGTGMSPEELSHVFDRFYRADPSRTRTTGGSGLGLTITKYLAEAHGGGITAESVLGKGTTFTITLPLAQQS